MKHFAAIAALLAGAAIMAATAKKKDEDRGEDMPTHAPPNREFFPAPGLTVMQNECLRIIETNIREHFPTLAGSQALILGIIERESSFRPRATRFEPHLNDSSIGLMQLLTRTAHWLGHEGTVENLMRPEINIYYGMKFLTWLRTRCREDQTCMIHSYNVGFAGFSRGRRNKIYFDRVTVSEKRFREILEGG